MKRAESVSSSPSFERVEWAKMSEPLLLESVLRGVNSAWTELLRRYDAQLRAAAWLATKHVRARLPEDYRDDVMAELYLRLVESDMRRLRVFDWSRGGTLVSWLCFLARQAGIDYVRNALATPEGAPIGFEALRVTEGSCVLASGAAPLRGSLSAWVRRKRERDARRESGDRARRSASKAVRARRQEAQPKHTSR